MYADILMYLQYTLQKLLLIYVHISSKGYIKQGFNYKYYTLEEATGTAQQNFIFDKLNFFINRILSKAHATYSTKYLNITFLAQ